LWVSILFDLDKKNGTLQKNKILLFSYKAFVSK